MLNAGADYYLDAWLSAPELVARVRVVLRFSAWLDESSDHGTLETGALSKDVLTNSS
jgi:DNA-binding response OmpR family regulator